MRVVRRIQFLNKNFERNAVFSSPEEVVAVCGFLQKDGMPRG